MTKIPLPFFSYYVNQITHTLALPAYTSQTEAGYDEDDDDVNDDGDGDGDDES